MKETNIRRDSLTHNK